MKTYLTKCLQALVYVAVVYYLTFLLGLLFFYPQFLKYLLQQEWVWVRAIIIEVPLRVAVELLVPLVASYIVLALFAIHMWPRSGRIFSAIQGIGLGFSLGMLTVLWMGRDQGSLSMALRLALVPAVTTMFYATVCAKKRAGFVEGDV